MYICVDFDGTIVEHAFPEIGAMVPGAIEGLKSFQAAGAKIILWTMRSDCQNGYDLLQEAVDYLESRGIILYGVNHNPDQSSWTQSPKAYGHIYIDDAAFGCPLIYPMNGKRPYADWSKITPGVMEKLKQMPP